MTDIPDGLSPALEAILERLPDAVLLADDNGRYIFANAEARKLLGVSAGEVRQMSLADVSGDPKSASLQWKQFLRDGNQEGEFTLRREDGMVVPIEFRAVTNFAPGCHLSIIRDASERKRLDDLIRHNEERFTKAFIASPAPTNIRVLETGAFIEVNESFGDALGFWRSDVLGRTASSLGLWKDESKLDGMLSQLRAGSTEARTRATLRSKDRTEREFSVAMRRVDMHGEPHVIAVYWDLSRN